MAHSMIVAPQPEAVEAGALVLKQGGNAVDAAMTCAVVQGVVDPQMCGIAGFGSMQLYLPEKGIHQCIDFHARAPAKATPDMWQEKIEGEMRDGFGFLLKGRVNEVGYQSIATPGSLKAYHEALSRFGTWSWKDVLQPAIQYAEEGFHITPTVYHYWISEDPMGRVSMIDRLRHTEASRKIYFTEHGDLRPMGSVLKNPDLGHTLRRIAAEGPGVFHEGDIANQIDADMARNRGLLSRKDLEQYRTTQGEPLWGEYRGHRIGSNRPPGGGVVLLEMLHILENFDLASLGHNTPQYIRVVSEAMKHATIDKDEYVGDPAFVNVPLDRLLDKSYARDKAEAIRRGEKAHVERFSKPETSHTTHLSVIDGQGNAVSMTHSLGMPSGVVTEGLGFMYNGCMGVFDPRPGRTGSIAPGKSRFSSICPSIVFKREQPYLIIGAPGGTQIAMGVLQVMINVIDFGMSMSDAVLAPRFSCMSHIIDVSARIPSYVCQEVESMGYHVLHSHLSYGNCAWVHSIMVKDGELSGGADPSKGGMALKV